MSDQPVQRLTPASPFALRPATAMWDIWSREPESLYDITRLFSGNTLETPKCQASEEAASTHREGDDIDSRARTLFHSFDAQQRQRLYDSISASMQGVADIIVERQVAQLSRIDPAYAAGVLAAVMRAKRPANSNPVRARPGFSPLSHAAE